ncbi:16S rRNA (guanine(527)-N(7))-methyltransferase RsmG [Granulicoccus sp. GXG6511]|uniref:16S rRNA (guanine(527)-N(7))-methyltransferase RsmG n=1 Tax=Granulicoccus sp. GXG6511 TaxID=3381351 RepID=UPI003D7E6BEE
MTGPEGGSGGAPKPAYSPGEAGSSSPTSALGEAGFSSPATSTGSDPVAIAREVFGERFDLAEEYRNVLATQGIEWGLIGPREVDRLWERHLLNSVALADLVPEGSEVIDVGSGAGLPGIPLAILRPDLGMTLLEPLLRRYNFLTQAVDNLGISDRVGVERGRAEDYDGAYDVVTCRAVAPLAKLLPWVIGLLGPRGAVLALKGSSAADEVRGVAGYLSKNRLQAQVLDVRAHPQAEVTTVVRIRRS